MRRIEAVTGPVSAELFRERTETLRELARAAARAGGLGAAVGRAAVGAGAGARARRRRGPTATPRSGWSSGADEIGGVRVVVEAVSAPDAKALLALSDAVRQKLGEAAVVLGTAVDGRVHLVANVAPALVERGVKAGDVVRAAAQVAGGGGGGRDTMAQAGGRDPEKLPEALATARAAIESALQG